MPDIEKVKKGLNNCMEYVQTAGCIGGGCPYEIECWHDGGEPQLPLMQDALKVIESQQRHIAELHHGIEALRDAMKGEARNG